MTEKASSKQPNVRGCARVCIGTAADETNILKFDSRTCAMPCQALDTPESCVRHKPENEQRARRRKSHKREAFCPQSGKPGYTPAPAVPRKDRTPELSPDRVRTWTSELLHRINKTRATHALAPIRQSATLTRVAQAHNEDQACAGRISHTGSDGSSLSERLGRRAYRMRCAAENVAAGQLDAAHVHASFMASRGHAKNVLKEGVEDVGLHVAAGGDGRLYWTEVFGRRKG